MTLVNKDQLDILASLRESVNEDKLELEQDVERLKKQNKELAEKNRMQLEQVNGLLMEKMTLQAEGISHREKMLLQRDIKDLRFVHILTAVHGILLTRCSNELNSALPGNVPEEFKRRWLVLHEDSIAQKETIKTLDEKLAKAKQVGSSSSLTAESGSHTCFQRFSSSRISSLRRPTQTASLQHRYVIVYYPPNP